MGPFTTGTVISSGVPRGRVLLVDVRGKLDPGYPPGANGDSSGSEKNVGFVNNLSSLLQFHFAAFLRTILRNS